MTSWPKSGPIVLSALSSLGDENVVASLSFWHTKATIFWLLFSYNKSQYCGPVFLLDLCSKLAKFSGNCHLANDWTCCVEHKLLTPFSLTCRLSIMVSTLASWSRGWEFKSHQRWGNFLIFKNYLRKLPISNKFEWGNNSNLNLRSSTPYTVRQLLHVWEGCCITVIG